MAVEFRRGVSELLHDIAIKAAVDKMQPIIGIVEDAKRSYGKFLVLEGIGVDDNPFRQDGRTWRDLSQSWLAKKQGVSQDKVNWQAQQYYRGMTGTLGAAIQSMPTDHLFGLTKVGAKAEVVESDGFFNPRINRRVETVFRDYSGRFASTENFERKRVRLTVKPFPNLTRPNMEIGQLNIDREQKEKLRKSDSIRPLVEPFTEWFFKNKIKSAVRSYLRNIK